MRRSLWIHDVHHAGYRTEETRKERGILEDAFEMRAVATYERGRVLLDVFLWFYGGDDVAVVDGGIFAQYLMGLQPLSRCVCGSSCAFWDSSLMLFVGAWGGD